MFINPLQSSSEDVKDIHPPPPPPPPPSASAFFQQLAICSHANIKLPSVHISSIRSEGARLHANSTFFPAEKTNKFAISKDEYMGVGQGAYCKEAEGGILASEDGYANGASDLFVFRVF